MTTGWWIVVGVGVWVAIANLRTLGPLWASPALERSQKVAQTVLMWLVPGSYIFVRQAVLTPGPELPEDATRGALAGAFASWTLVDGGRDAHRQGFQDGGGSPAIDFGDGGHHDIGSHHDGAGGFDGGGGSDGGSADGGA